MYPGASGGRRPQYQHASGRRGRRRAGSSGYDAAGGASADAAAFACAAAKKKSGLVLQDIERLLSLNGTLLWADFDGKVRQFLHAIHSVAGEPGVQAALLQVHETTSDKRRDDVRNWPAYVQRLLKRAFLEYQAAHRQDADSDQGSCEVAAARAPALPPGPAVWVPRRRAPREARARVVAAPAPEEAAAEATGTAASAHAPADAGADADALAAAPAHAVAAAPAVAAPAAGCAAAAAAAAAEGWAGDGEKERRSSGIASLPSFGASTTEGGQSWRMSGSASVSSCCSLGDGQDGAAADFVVVPRSPPESTAASWCTLSDDGDFVLL